MEPTFEQSFNGPSLQEKYSPKSVCFGCGPVNEHGLHIGSHPALWEEAGRPDLVVARFTPKKFHEAFPGMMNGGIIGALLDCHSNWTAAYHLMKKSGDLTQAPCTVTGDFHVKLRRPTPSNGEILLKSWVAESKDDRALIHAELIAGEKVCATCEGNFIAVKPGHPAYHRW